MATGKFSFFSCANGQSRVRDYRYVGVEQVVRHPYLPTKFSQFCMSSPMISLLIAHGYSSEYTQSDDFRPW